MLTNFQIVTRTNHFLTITNASNHFAGCINKMDLPNKIPLKGGLVGVLIRALDVKKQAKVPTLNKVGGIDP
jgi:hypothetical protein